jgi:pimeloyl-ACP methyl ester carboxylesterase
MDRASSFTRLMAKLPEWSIVAYDRRGYAGSAGAGVSDRLDDHVTDLLAVLDGRPAVVLGHSFGGIVVLAAAARVPELIPSAVVWEPPQPWSPSWPATTPSAGAAAELSPQDRAEWFMRRMLGDRIWARLPASTRAQRRAEGPALVADFASLRTGARPIDPAGIHVPVVVGRGGRSSPRHRRATRELAQALRRGRLVEIADAAHSAHLSHPADLAGLLRSAAPG